MRRLLIIAILSAAMVLPAQAQFRGGMRAGPIARPMPGFRAAPVMPRMNGMPRFAPSPRFAPMPRGMVRVIPPPGTVVTRRGGFGAFGGFFPFSPFVPFNGRRQLFFLTFRNCNPFLFNSCQFLFFNQFHHRFFSPFFNGFGSPFFGGFGSPFFGGFGGFPIVAGGPAFWPDYSDYQAAQAQAAPQYVIAVQPQPEPVPQPAPAAQPPAPAQPAQPTAQPEPIQLPPTVLVFRDQHREEVKNYAIVGQTLYEFLPGGRRHKIALSDLDLPATEKANDDRGVDFRVPPHRGT